MSTAEVTGVVTVQKFEFLPLAMEPVKKGPFDPNSGTHLFVELFSNVCECLPIYTPRTARNPPKIFINTKLKISKGSSAQIQARRRMHLSFCGILHQIMYHRKSLSLTVLCSVTSRLNLSVQNMKVQGSLFLWTFF